jgi:hypothetical protein
VHEGLEVDAEHAWDGEYGLVLELREPVFAADRPAAAQLALDARAQEVAVEVAQIELADAAADVELGLRVAGRAVPER